MVCGLQTLGQPKTFLRGQQGQSGFPYLLFFCCVDICWGGPEARVSKTADTSVVCLPKYTHMIKSNIPLSFSKVLMKQ